MNFEFKNGQWAPCGKLLEFPEGEEWHDTLKRYGFYPMPMHIIGVLDGFQTEVFTLREGETFVGGITHFVCFTVACKPQYFFTGDILALIDLLHKLATISHAEQFSSELQSRDAQAGIDPESLAA